MVSNDLTYIGQTVIAQETERIIAEKVKEAMWKTAAAAGVTGLIVGALLGRLFK